MGERARPRVIVVGVAAVVAVEVLIAGPRRLERARGVWSGDVTWASVHGLLSLLWLPLLCLVVLALTTHAVGRHPRGGIGVDAVQPDRAQLGRLLTSGRVHAVGQPIVDLATGEVRGVEALARFPDGGSPERWFAQALGAGRGVELELLALRRALELVPHLPEGVYLSVNASAQSIVDPHLSRLLVDAPLPLSRLVLEVTEHEAVVCYDSLIEVLAPLRGAGLRVAVDDVGAGYASFRHVLELRPDIIKLDRSLVHGIDTDGGSRAVVTAIALVALEVGAAITAEGVETMAELDTVVMLGVDSAQGYLIGRPGSDPTTWLPSGVVDMRGRPGTLAPER